MKEYFKKIKWAVINVVIQFTLFIIVYIAKNEDISHIIFQSVLLIIAVIILSVNIILIEIEKEKTNER